MFVCLRAYLRNNTTNLHQFLSMLLTTKVVKYFGIFNSFDVTYGRG